MILLSVEHCSLVTDVSVAQSVNNATGKCREVQSSDYAHGVYLDKAGQLFDSDVQP